VEFSPAKASDTAVASVHGAGTRAKYIYFTGNYLNASSAGGFGPALLGIYPATARGDVAPLHATTGKNTRLVSPNALWIDPANGALWVCDFNEPFLSMFSAVKWGNVAPRATLHTGFALHACGGIGLSNDGAVVASGFINGAVATWRAGSVGSVAPQRVIRGASTKLIRPTAIAFDRSGDYIVSLQTNPGAIETFDARASGNVTPLRVIAGPQTQLAEIAAMTFDRGSNLIWAASESTNTITAYHAESQGDVKPVVSIHGNNTRLDNPYGIAVDAAGYVYVGNDPQHGRNPHGSILVFAPGANGNATPVQIIKGKKTGLRGVNGLTVY
jgi:sugar lactone lactonase YvrE